MAERRFHKACLLVVRIHPPLLQILSRKHFGNRGQLFYLLRHEWLGTVWSIIENYF